MPIPASINDLSTTAGSNSPAGSESPSLIDDYLRTYASYIAQLRDNAQNNAFNFAAAGGSANAITATYSPAITTLTDGTILYLKAAAANTAAVTFSPNGLTAKAIVSLGHAALIGGEIAANGDVWIQYNSSIGGGSWVLIASSGGNAVSGRLINTQYIYASGTYTKTVGTTKIRVRGVGPGGAGGGTQITSAGQAAAGGGGGAGAYGEGNYDATGFTTQTVVIGSPGVGVAGANGGNGGTSSFGTLLTLPGGNGGQAGANLSVFPQVGGLGGATSTAPTGSSLGNPGDSGGVGRPYSAASSEGGAGGKSQYGAGVFAGTALGYGAGGNGRSATASSGAGTGFTGAPSFFVVEELA